MQISSHINHKFDKFNIAWKMLNKELPSPKSSAILTITC